MKIASGCNYEKWQRVLPEVRHHYRFEAVRLSERWDTKQERDWWEVDECAECAFREWKARSNICWVLSVKAIKAMFPATLEQNHTKYWMNRTRELLLTLIITILVAKDDMKKIKNQSPPELKMSGPLTIVNVDTYLVFFRLFVYFFWYIMDILRRENAKKGLIVKIRTLSFLLAFQISDYLPKLRACVCQ